jgi:hypothetical protein
VLETHLNWPERNENLGAGSVAFRPQRSLSVTGFAQDTWGAVFDRNYRSARHNLLMLHSEIGVAETATLIS